MANRKWMICPACEGEGSCVNPAIDCNGLSASEMHEDPDFAENYFGGLYDVTCEACHGSGKILTERMDELRENAADRRLAAMENGDPEAYYGAGDYRWG